MKPNGTAEKNLWDSLTEWSNRLWEWRETAMVSRARDRFLMVADAVEAAVNALTGAIDPDDDRTDDQKRKDAAAALRRAADDLENPENGRW